MDSKHRRPVSWLISAAILAACAAGCGGGDAEVPKGGGKPRAAKQRDPSERKDNKTAAKTNSAKKKSKPEEATEETPQDDIYAAANPNDVFVVSVDQPNFEIVGQRRDLPDGAEYSVVWRPAGVNSSDFTASVPLKESPHESAASFQLPAGFTALPAAGYSEQGLPLQIRCEKDNAEMVLVPAGVFEMGTANGPPESGPPLAVYLDAFYIDVTEVTVAQYQRFAEDRKIAHRSAAPTEYAIRQQPVVNVPWNEADSYAKWSNKSLPTEAQWEKAARSKQNFPHVWGTGASIWARARKPGQIDPVKSFPTDVSPYGVYDLAGNAREWCLDHFLENAYQEASAQGATTLRNWSGPRASPTRNRKVVKGGGSDWNAWNREGIPPRDSLPDLGFRCVLSISASQ